MPSNTPETPPLEPVEVTQAARNAAVRLLEQGDQDWQAKEIRLGQGDHFPLVQAFARFERDTIERHRQSSSNAGGVDMPLLELVAGYADYKAISDDRWEQGKAAGYRELGQLVSAALTPSALSGDNSQSSSNAGGVDERAVRWIKHNLRLAEQMMKASADQGNGYANFAAHDAHHALSVALASLSTPTAEPTPAQSRRPIERAVALDLLHAVYAAEGWTRAEGESMVERVSTVYDVTSDPRRNRFIATPKNAALTTPPTPDRIGKDAVREALDGLEWTEDGYSLRTPYDGDADGDGRPIIVGGETVLTFDDSDVADKYRIRILEALSATPAQEGEQ